MVEDISVHQGRPAGAAPPLSAEQAGLLATNGFYSPLFRELMERLLRDEPLRQRRLDLDAPDVIEFMRHYDNAVNTWPALIDRRMTAAFDAFIQIFPRLMSKAINAYFGNDTNKFADYMNLPGFVLELINGAPLDTRQLLVRYDAVFSANAFKIVEVNVGSNIGGWQLDWLEPNCRAILQSAVDADLWSLHYRSATRSMLTALSKVIARTFPAARGTLLFFIGPLSEEEERMNVRARTGLQAMYREIAQPLLPDAKLLFFSDIGALEFPADGTVVFHGERIECLMLNLPEGVGVPRSVALRLLASCLAGKVIYPDSPLHAVFGNKLGLALLHEPELAALFTAEEQQLVDAHVPWAARAAPRRVRWRERDYALQQLLREHKDCFVLKKAQSMQGRDVFIGRFTDAAVWDAGVAAALDEQGWLVQEYCAPDQVLAYDHELGFCAFEFVWGLFHFDDAYGGAFVRGVPMRVGPDDASRSGVINSARGAREFAVFEANRKKQHILL